ncbi:MAG: FKBP-type peptidyl-prolyl cis-trans isomerase [Gemmatimonadales bacterium]
MRRLLILAGTLGLSGCLNVAQPADNPTDPATETFAASLGVDIATMTKTGLGDYYKDLIIGDGPALSAPQSVFITYTGYLKNGAVFGSQENEPSNLSFNVPVGLRDGMLGMRVNGERLIVIPSELGYGATPNGPIPPNSTLIFHVRLESITE